MNFDITIFFNLPIPLLGQKKILKGEMGRVIDKKLDEKIQKQQDEIHELQNIINDLRGVNREVRIFSDEKSVKHEKWFLKIKKYAQV